MLTDSAHEGTAALLIWTHSFTTGPDWLVNADVGIAGTYDVSFWAARHSPGGVFNVYAGIGESFTQFTLPATDYSWVYYTTRITTAGGPLKLGAFTSIDLIAYVDSINVQPVPEPANALCIGAGLCGLTVYVRRRRKPG